MSPLGCALGFTPPPAAFFGVLALIALTYLAIVELLKMNEAVADATLRKASAADIEKAGRKQGMVTLLEDGLAKVQEGQTSLVELLRVVQ